MLEEDLFKDIGRDVSYLDRLEYSEIVLQLVYVDGMILVICTGSSGEAYHLVDKESSGKLAEESIATHKLIENCDVVKKKDKSFLASKLKEFGAYLFDTIFKEGILDLLNVAIGQSIVQRKDIIIRLMLGRGFLNTVPWELFFNEDRYLCQVYDIIRHPFSLQPVRRPYNRKSNPKRILFVGSNPANAHINVEESVSVIEEVLKSREKVNGNIADNRKFLLRKVVGGDCTHRGIANSVYDGADILHFLGHGQCEDTEDGLKYSFLIHSEKDPGNIEKLPVEMLESFCRANPMQLAILNACNSDFSMAYGEDEDTLKKMLDGKHPNQYSMAHALIRTGVECVIGMSHKISKPGAVVLNRRLYRAIVEREESITKAVRQIRLELYAHSETDMGSIYPADWLTPILYLRGQSYYL